MRMKTKLSRLAAASMTAGALLLGSIVAAPSATAARSNVWADVYYRAGCSTGGYSKLSTGPYDQLGWAVDGMRYSEYAGGDKFAHGAWMSHIGSVRVQPWAQVQIYSTTGVPTVLTNNRGEARCYPVNASQTYTDLLIYGI